MKFPKQIYVLTEDVGDGEDEYLSVFPVGDRSFLGYESGKKVAVYELKAVKTLKVTAELE